MTLIEQIKKDQLAARKEHNYPLTSLLTTLIGEADMVGKDVKSACGQFIYNSGDELEKFKVS